MASPTFSTNESSFHFMGENQDRSLTPESEATVSEPVVKKGRRGMPRKYDDDDDDSLASTGKLQTIAAISGDFAKTAEGSFKTHVIIVGPGEDVVSKILTFFETAPEAVFIISANGEVSSVLIRQLGAAGGILRYEGHFEVIYLSGSCTSYTRNGMLTIALANPDATVFGGVLESPLIAANHIQIVVGTCKENVINQIQKGNSSGSPKGNQDSVKAPM